MRCNTGVSPTLLTDQHLIAEYRELFIPVGQLKKLNWISKSPIPDTFRLGKGHITFWRDKQLYLKRRHEAIVREMLVRGFNPSMSFYDLDTIPAEFLNDWFPTRDDSLLIRERIIERLLQKPEWYRYKGKYIYSQLDSYVDMLRNSEVIY